MKKLLLVAIFLLSPLFALAQTNTHQGGTGLIDVSAGSILFGSTPSIRMASSSALQFNATASRLTVTYASTTGITATNFFGSLIGNAGTATALFANGANCSSGQAPLGVDASGAVESCFDVWTEAENTAAAYTPQSRTLTINGTTKQITLSAGAQTLAGDRTWIASLPSFVLFPGDIQAVNSTTTNATTTNLHITGLTGLTQCLQVDTNGKVTGTGSGCGSSSGLSSYDAWTHPIAGVSATTSGLVITAASSTFNGNLNILGSATATNATTTNLKISGQLNWGSGTGLIVTTSGVASTYAGSNPCTNQVALSLSASGVISCTSVTNLMLSNSTISGIALGNNLAAHTTNSTLSGTSYNGSAAVSDWGINLGSSNIWTVGVIFQASSTIGAGGAGTGLTINGQATTTGLHLFPGGLLANASSTIRFLDTINGTTTYSTSTSLKVTNLTVGSLSALLLTTSGVVSAYGGASGCTNQFITAISSTGGTTCTTVALTSLATQAANTFLANGTGATAVPTAIASSSIFTGSTGQFGLFASTGGLIGTSSLFASTASYIGVGSTTPFAGFSVGRGNGSSTLAILVAENQAATSTSMTIDWRNGNTQLIRMTTAAFTVNFTNFTDGAQLKLIVCNQTAGTTGAITFGTQVLWPGGTAPTQTTTANKCDVWSFIATQATSTLKILGAQTANF